MPVPTSVESRGAVDLRGSTGKGNLIIAAAIVAPAAITTLVYLVRTYRSSYKRYLAFYKTENVAPDESEGKTPAQRQNQMAFPSFARHSQHTMSLLTRRILRRIRFAISSTLLLKSKTNSNNKLDNKNSFAFYLKEKQDKKERKRRRQKVGANAVLSDDVDSVEKDEYVWLRAGEVSELGRERTKRHTRSSKKSSSVLAPPSSSSSDSTTSSTSSHSDDGIEYFDTDECSASSTEKSSAGDAEVADHLDLDDKLPTNGAAQVSEELLKERKLRKNMHEAAQLSLVSDVTAFVKSKGLRRNMEKVGISIGGPTSATQNSSSPRSSSSSSSQSKHSSRTSSSSAVSLSASRVSVYSLQRGTSGNFASHNSFAGRLQGPDGLNFFPPNSSDQHENSINTLGGFGSPSHLDKAATLTTDEIAGDEVQPEPAGPPNSNKFYNKQLKKVEEAKEREDWLRRDRLDRRREKVKKRREALARFPSDANMTATVQSGLAGGNPVGGLGIGGSGGFYSFGSEAEAIPATLTKDVNSTAAFINTNGIVFANPPQEDGGFYPPRPEVLLEIIVEGPSCPDRDMLVEDLTAYVDAVNNSVLIANATYGAGVRHVMHGLARGERKLERRQRRAVEREALLEKAATVDALVEERRRRKREKHNWPKSVRHQHAHQHNQLIHAAGGALGGSGNAVISGSGYSFTTDPTRRDSLQHGYGANPTFQHFTNNLSLVAANGSTTSGHTVTASSVANASMFQAINHINHNGAVNNLSMVSAQTNGAGYGVGGSRHQIASQLTNPPTVSPRSGAIIPNPSTRSGVAPYGSGKVAVAGSPTTPGSIGSYTTHPQGGNNESSSVNTNSNPTVSGQGTAPTYGPHVRTYSGSSFAGSNAGGGMGTHGSMTGTVTTHHGSSNVLRTITHANIAAATMTSTTPAIAAHPSSGPSGAPFASLGGGMAMAGQQLSANGSFRLGNSSQVNYATLGISNPVTSGIDPNLTVNTTITTISSNRPMSGGAASVGGVSASSYASGAAISAHHNINSSVMSTATPPTNTFRLSATGAMGGRSRSHTTASVLGSGPPTSGLASQFPFHRMGSSPTGSHPTFNASPQDDFYVNNPHRGRTSGAHSPHGSTSAASLYDRYYQYDFFSPNSIATAASNNGGGGGGGGGSASANPGVKGGVSPLHLQLTPRASNTAAVRSVAFANNYSEPGLVVGAPSPAGGHLSAGQSPGSLPPNPHRRTGSYVTPFGKTELAAPAPIPTITSASSTPPQQYLPLSGKTSGEGADSLETKPLIRGASCVLEAEEGASTGLTITSPHYDPEFGLVESIVSPKPEHANASGAGAEDQTQEGTNATRKKKKVAKYPKVRTVLKVCVIDTMAALQQQLQMEHEQQLEAYYEAYAAHSDATNAILQNQQQQNQHSSLNAGHGIPSAMMSADERMYQTILSPTTASNSSNGGNANHNSALTPQNPIVPTQLPAVFGVPTPNQSSLGASLGQLPSWGPTGSGIISGGVPAVSAPNNSNLYISHPLGSTSGYPFNSTSQLPSSQQQQMSSMPFSGYSSIAHMDSRTLATTTGTQSNVSPSGGQQYYSPGLVPFPGPPPPPPSMPTGSALQDERIIVYFRFEDGTTRPCCVLPVPDERIYRGVPAIIARQIACCCDAGGQDLILAAARAAAHSVEGGGISNCSFIGVPVPIEDPSASPHQFGNLSGANYHGSPTPPSGFYAYSHSSNPHQTHTNEDTWSVAAFSVSGQSVMNGAGNNSTILGGAGASNYIFHNGSSVGGGNKSGVATTGGGTGGAQSVSSGQTPVLGHSRASLPALMTNSSNTPQQTMSGSITTTTGGVTNNSYAAPAAVGGGSTGKAEAISGRASNESSQYLSSYKVPPPLSMQPADSQGLVARVSGGPQQTHEEVIVVGGPANSTATATPILVRNTVASTKPSTPQPPSVPIVSYNNSFVNTSTPFMRNETNCHLVDSSSPSPATGTATMKSAVVTSPPTVFRLNPSEFTVTTVHNISIEGAMVGDPKLLPFPCFAAVHGVDAEGGEEEIDDITTPLTVNQQTGSINSVLVPPHIIAGGPVGPASQTSTFQFALPMLLQQQQATPIMSSTSVGSGGGSGPRRIVRRRSGPFSVEARHSSGGPPPRGSSGSVCYSTVTAIGPGNLCSSPTSGEFAVVGGGALASVGSSTMKPMSATLCPIPTANLPHLMGSFLGDNGQFLPLASIDLAEVSAVHNSSDTNNNFGTLLQIKSSRDNSMAAVAMNTAAALVGGVTEAKLSTGPHIILAQAFPSPDASAESPKLAVASQLNESELSAAHNATTRTDESIESPHKLSGEDDHKLSPPTGVPATLPFVSSIGSVTHHTLPIFMLSSDSHPLSASAAGRATVSGFPTGAMLGSYDSAQMPMNTSHTATLGNMNESSIATLPGHLALNPALAQTVVGTTEPSESDRQEPDRNTPSTNFATSPPNQQHFGQRSLDEGSATTTTNPTVTSPTPDTLLSPNAVSTAAPTPQQRIWRGGSDPLAHFHSNNNSPSPTTFAMFGKVEDLDGSKEEGEGRADVLVKSKLSAINDVTKAATVTGGLISPLPPMQLSRDDDAAARYEATGHSPLKSLLSDPTQPLPTPAMAASTSSSTPNPSYPKTSKSPSTATTTNTSTTAGGRSVRNAASASGSNPAVAGAEYVTPVPSMGRVTVTGSLVGVHGRSSVGGGLMTASGSGYIAFSNEPGGIGKRANSLVSLQLHLQGGSSEALPMVGGSVDSLYGLMSAGNVKATAAAALVTSISAEPSASVVDLTAKISDDALNDAEDGQNDAQLPNDTQLPNDSQTNPLAMFTAGEAALKHSTTNNNSSATDGKIPHADSSVSRDEGSTATTALPPAHHQHPSIVRGALSPSPPNESRSPLGTQLQKSLERSGPQPINLVVNVKPTPETGDSKPATRQPTEELFTDAEPLQLTPLTQENLRLFTSTTNAKAKSVAAKEPADSKKVADVAAPAPAAPTVPINRLKSPTTGDNKKQMPGQVSAFTRGAASLAASATIAAGAIASGNLGGPLNQSGTEKFQTSSGSMPTLLVAAPSTQPPRTPLVRPMGSGNLSSPSKPLLSPPKPPAAAILQQPMNTFAPTPLARSSSNHNLLPRPLATKGTAQQVPLVTSATNGSTTPITVTGGASPTPLADVYTSMPNSQAHASAARNTFQAINTNMNSAYHHSFTSPLVANTTAFPSAGSFNEDAMLFQSAPPSPSRSEGNGPPPPAATLAQHASNKSAFRRLDGVTQIVDTASATSSKLTAERLPPSYVTEVSNPQASVPAGVDHSNPVSVHLPVLHPPPSHMRDIQPPVTDFTEAPHHEENLAHHGVNDEHLHRQQSSTLNQLPLPPLLAPEVLDDVAEKLTFAANNSDWLRCVIHEKAFGCVMQPPKTNRFQQGGGGVDPNDRYAQQVTRPTSTSNRGDIQIGGSNTKGRAAGSPQAVEWVDGVREFAPPNPFSHASLFAVEVKPKDPSATQGITSTNGTVSASSPAVPNPQSKKPQPVGGWWSKVTSLFSLAAKRVKKGNKFDDDEPLNEEEEEALLYGFNINGKNSYHTATGLYTNTSDGASGNQRIEDILSLPPITALVTDAVMRAEVYLIDVSAARNDAFVSDRLVADAVAANAIAHHGGDFNELRRSIEEHFPQFRELVEVSRMSQPSRSPSRSHIPTPVLGGQPAFASFSASGVAGTSNAAGASFTRPKQYATSSGGLTSTPTTTAYTKGPAQQLLMESLLPPPLTVLPPLSTAHSTSAAPPPPAGLGYSASDAFGHNVTNTGTNTGTTSSCGQHHPTAIAAFGAPVSSSGTPSSMRTRSNSAEPFGAPHYGMPTAASANGGRSADSGGLSAAASGNCVASLIDDPLLEGTPTYPTAPSHIPSAVGISPLDPATLVTQAHHALLLPSTVPTSESPTTGPQSATRGPHLTTDSKYSPQFADQHTTEAIEGMNASGVLLTAAEASGKGGLPAVLTPTGNHVPAKVSQAASPFRMSPATSSHHPSHHHHHNQPSPTAPSGTSAAATPSLPRQIRLSDVCSHRTLVQFLVQNRFAFMSAMLTASGSNSLETCFGTDAPHFAFLKCAYDSLFFVQVLYTLVAEEYKGWTAESFAEYINDAFDHDRPEVSRHSTRIFRALNKSRSGVITFEELCGWLAKKLSSRTTLHPDQHLVGTLMSLRLPLALFMDRRDLWREYFYVLRSISDDEAHI